jgi:hypothetical protein
MTYLSGLKDFISSWDDRFVSETDWDTFRESPQGHINRDGTSACSDSPIFSKYHRKFKKSIELGVRELTVAVILKFNCITYSSCQGHFSTADAVMRQRYVGVVPRNEKEYQDLFNLFQGLALLTNAQVADTSVRVFVQEDTLASEDYIMPCLNLFFVPVAGDEETYFRDLEVVYKKLLDIIASGRQ